MAYDLHTLPGILLLNKALAFNTNAQAWGHETEVMIPICYRVLMTVVPIYKWPLSVHHVSQMKPKTLIREGFFLVFGCNVAISQISRLLKKYGDNKIQIERGEIKMSFQII